MFKKFLSLTVILTLGACVTAKHNSNSEVNIDTIDDVARVAIKGYDPVAYFKARKAIKGHKQISSNWNGANWFFASQDNKNAFEINPSKYAPQYGGYCAYGVSVPETKIDIDPNAWHINKGKLYLNYTPETQVIWLEDKESHIEDADKIWPKIKND